MRREHGVAVVEIGGRTEEAQWTARSEGSSNADNTRLQAKQAEGQDFHGRSHLRRLSVGGWIVRRKASAGVREEGLQRRGAFRDHGASGSTTEITLGQGAN